MHAVTNAIKGILYFSMQPCNMMDILFFSSFATIQVNQKKKKKRSSKRIYPIIFGPAPKSSISPQPLFVIGCQFIGRPELAVSVVAFLEVRIRSGI
jgi:hypothetical protein